MTVYILIIAFTLTIICVENRMIKDYKPVETLMEDPITQPTTYQDLSKIIINTDKSEESGTIDDNRNPLHPNQPCSVVVLSNVQSPGMQSLLRKYRYDANGILIPSSVKYFIKLPQGYGSEPLLVPLNDKAFSPLGGFVRYYKEVPPIPQSW